MEGKSVGQCGPSKLPVKARMLETCCMCVQDEGSMFTLVTCHCSWSRDLLHVSLTSRLSSEATRDETGFHSGYPECAPIASEITAKTYFVHTDSFADEICQKNRCQDVWCGGLWTWRRVEVCQRQQSVYLIYYHICYMTSELCTEILTVTMCNSVIFIWADGIPKYIKLNDKQEIEVIR